MCNLTFQHTVFYIPLPLSYTLTLNISDLSILESYEAPLLKVVTLFVVLVVSWQPHADVLKDWVS